MEIKDLVRRGTKFEATCEIKNLNTGYAYVTSTSPEFTIRGIATFQIQVYIIKTGTGYAADHNNLIMVKFGNKSPSNLQQTYKLSSKKLNIHNQAFKSDESTWRLIYDVKTNCPFSFDLSLNVETGSKIGSFETLLDDTQLVDFQLRGEDGPVPFHKVIMHAASSVLRKMLETEWRDRKEGSCDVRGATREVISHFKRFLYTGKLPDTFLRELLMIANLYRIPDMEQKCVDKIVTNLNAQNALEISEFAVKHKMKRLHLAVLECFECGAVKVDDMRLLVSKESKSLYSPMECPALPAPSPFRPPPLSHLPTLIPTPGLLPPGFTQIGKPFRRDASLERTPIKPRRRSRT